jgi:hypothetical protein
MSSPDFRAWKSKQEADNKNAPQLSGAGVYVPPGYAAMIPRANGTYKWIATSGLGPCIGVLVVGSTGVGVAHITAPKEPDSEFLNKLANYATLTIPNPTRIVMSSSGTKPTEPFFTILQAALQAKLGGKAVEVRDKWELGYSLKDQEVVSKISQDHVNTPPAIGVT